MKRLPYRKLVAVVLSACLVCGQVSPAFAHNELIHQKMIDYAYNLVLAMAQVPQPAGDPVNPLLYELNTLITDDPTIAEFFKAAGEALPRLKAMSTGLFEDQTPCLDSTVAQLVDTTGDAIPDWPSVLNSKLPNLPMQFAVYPVNPSYNFKNGTCEIPPFYTAPGATRHVNPATGATDRERLMSQDHTGVTLGYWAASADHAFEDWVFRSTTLEFLQQPVVSTGTAGGVSALVALACLFTCGFFPISCIVCPAAAYEAGSGVYEEINSVNPHEMSGEDYVGFGHFVDMKPLSSSESTYDVNRGKYSPKAGPDGNPDLTEEAVIALFDLLGMHVRYDLSEGPKRYEIHVSGTNDYDFHPDSVSRDAGDWENPGASEIQYTPLDNLALDGWKAFTAHWQDSDPEWRAVATRHLGWPLHAIGDATSPMHTIGASGFGHRPYEDSVEERWYDLTFFDPFDPDNADNDSAALRQARDIISRAYQWRQYIQQWRLSHGTTNVPVREVISLLADQTRNKADAHPSIYKPDASFEYVFGSKSEAIDMYDTASALSFQRDTFLDGVAVAVAFLISATEVSQ